MSTNIILYDLDGTIPVPDIGILSGQFDSKERLIIKRFIENPNNGISEITIPAFKESIKEGMCSIIFYISDVYNLRSVTHFKRHLFNTIGKDKFPSSAVYRAGAVDFYIPEIISDELFNLFEEVYKSGIGYFIFLFSVERAIDPTEFNVSDIFQGLYLNIANSLKTGEVALFSANQKSRDIVEFVSVKRISL